jgi:hypothetical protein
MGSYFYDSHNKYALLLRFSQQICIIIITILTTNMHYCYDSHNKYALLLRFSQQICIIVTILTTNMHPNKSQQCRAYLAQPGTVPLVKYNKQL